MPVKKYKEKIRHGCGHVIEHITLYKLPRKQVQHMRDNFCGACQLVLLLADTPHGRINLQKSEQAGPHRGGKNCLGPGCIYCDEEEAEA